MKRSRLICHPGRFRMVIGNQVIGGAFNLVRTLGSLDVSAEKWLGGSG